ncbi:MAG: hypothetical protein OJJ21_16680 [Ferrovibrio sp.]|uniref:hypothetical protein n=1 Tax=Ferrovibrio sp. TaxID=1917215 RepID=UPI002609C694|nr:hypothetical protein [Ferrovibrio sp.]MCW0235238.1 hypothetical protein [Ferrovibrio sp.]
MASPDMAPHDSPQAAMTYTIILDGVPLSPVGIERAAPVFAAAIAAGMRVSLVGRRER